MKKLKQTIQQNRSVFKIRLVRGGSAENTIMEITLDRSEKPLYVKVCKYPADQRRVLDVFFGNLVKLVSLKMCPAALWQAAPHLVPKDSKSRLGTTLDLNLVNAATKAEQ